MHVWNGYRESKLYVLCYACVKSAEHFLKHKSRKGLLNGVSDRILFPFQICFRLYLYRSFFALISMTYSTMFVAYIIFYYVVEYLLSTAYEVIVSEITNA